MEVTLSSGHPELWAAATSSDKTAFLRPIQISGTSKRRELIQHPCGQNPVPVVSAFHYRVAATTVFDVPVLTIGSNRSLRSLGRAKARPLTKRYVPIMKTKQIIVGTTLLIFSPEKFSEYATKAGIEQEFRDNKQLREAHPDGKAPPEVVAEWKKHNLDRANAIRGSYLSSLLITFSSIIIGIIIGTGLKSLFGNPSTLITNVIQVLGVGILLSATLSVLGSKIESYKGKTLAEHIDRYLFRWQYILGSLLFFLALSWSA